MSYCDIHGRYADYASECPKCRDAERLADERREELREASERVEEAIQDSEYSRANPGQYDCPKCLYRTLRRNASRCPICHATVPGGFWEPILARESKMAEEEAKREVERERIRAGQRAKNLAVEKERAKDAANARAIKGGCIAFCVLIVVGFVLVGGLGHSPDRGPKITDPDNATKLTVHEQSFNIPQGNSWSTFQTGNKEFNLDVRAGYVVELTVNKRPEYKGSWPERSFIYRSSAGAWREVNHGTQGNQITNFGQDIECLSLRALGADAKVVMSLGTARRSSAEVPDAFLGERYPVTRLRMIQTSDIRGMSFDELRYAINEMFARHGAVFGKAEVARYFQQFSWYRPRAGLTFDQIEEGFSETEKANLKVLGGARDSKSGR